MKKLFTLIILFACCNRFIGQTNFISIKSGDWNDSTTWNTLAIPSVSNNVTLTLSHTITISGAAYSRNLYISFGAALISTATTTINTSGNWNNSGNFTASGGKVIMSGVALQLISGNSATTFYELEINNPLGASLRSDQKIKKLLSLTQGTLSTAGFKLTFLSDNLLTASLGQINSGADINGKITVQRSLSSTSTGWRFLGSPVRTTLQDWNNDFITSGFPGSTYPSFNFCSVYSYDETVLGTSDYGYVMPGSTADSLIPGAGYWCWIGPTPLTLEVTGVPAKFAQSFNVSLTANAGKFEDGWNMLANPYASAIDWDSPSWNKTGMQNAIYIWNPQTEQYSTYINGVGINGGTNIIPSSRAFWVQANQNNPVLSCNENVKTLSQEAFLKSSSTPAIRLMLSGNNYSDETIICFSENNSTAVKSSEDAVKLFSDNYLVPSISSVMDSMNLAVNSLPLSASSVIPVKVKVGLSGTYTIAMAQGYQLSLNSCLYLEDLVTGAFINLKNAVSYSFYISDTTSAPRFFVHTTRPLIKSSVNVTCSYKENGKAIATMNDDGKWSFTWKDGLGNTLAQHPATTQSDTLKNLAPGTYYVAANGKNHFCPVLEEQIIINRPQELSVTVKAKDNVCKGENNGWLGVTLADGGSLPYNYKWSNGKNSMVIQELKSGVYTLILSDANGCSDTTYHVVKTKSQMNPAFEIEDDTASLFVNQQIHFTNLTTGSQSSYWNFGNEGSEEENPFYAFKTAGTHTIELTSADKGCFVTASKIIYVKDIKANHDATMNVPDKQITIYNSGGNAIIVFNLPDASPGNVSVFTAEGKEVSSQNIEGFKNTETVALGESHGMYVVRVKINGAEISGKCIK
ncbi:MAG: T9SS type A sorting domain-containing protein [Bacteroidetes bacterium]|nr:T9SS type A sorting domain-containing protein [Bacteroidota bacterium]